MLFRGVARRIFLKTLWSDTYRLFIFTYKMACAKDYRLPARLKKIVSESTNPYLNIWLAGRNDHMAVIKGLMITR